MGKLTLELTCSLILTVPIAYRKKAAYKELQSIEPGSSCYAKLGVDAFSLGLAGYIYYSLAFPYLC